MACARRCLYQQNGITIRQLPQALLQQNLPVTDIFETDQALTVILEMPGVDKDRVDVRVENDILSVEGQVDLSKYQGLAPLYIEYNVGNYARSFQLSSKIEQERITAELKDGVMTLVLPKAEKAKPRRIAVN
jgi:HSP20 family protein